MKYLIISLLPVSLLIFFVFFTSCEKRELEPVTNYHEIKGEYLVSDTLPDVQFNLTNDFRYYMMKRHSDFVEIVATGTSTKYGNRFSSKDPLLTGEFYFDGEYIFYNKTLNISFYRISLRTL